jgi:hypothetical protein
MNIDEVIACEEAITSFPFNLMAYEYIKIYICSVILETDKLSTLKSNFKIF